MLLIRRLPLSFLYLKIKNRSHIVGSNYVPAGFSAATFFLGDTELKLETITLPLFLSL